MPLSTIGWTLSELSQRDHQQECSAARAAQSDTGRRPGSGLALVGLEDGADGASATEQLLDAVEDLFKAQEKHARQLRAARAPEAEVLAAVARYEATGRLFHALVDVLALAHEDDVQEDGDAEEGGREAASRSAVCLEPDILSEQLISGAGRRDAGDDEYDEFLASSFFDDLPGMAGGWNRRRQQHLQPRPPLQLLVAEAAPGRPAELLDELER